MRPSLLLGAQPLPRAEYVGGAFLFSGENPVTNTLDTVLNLGALGAAALDYAMVFCTSQSVGPGGSIGYPSITSADAGWTQDNYTWTPGMNVRSSTFHKRLTANDLANPITIRTGSYATFPAVIYRRPKSAVRRALQYDGDLNSTHTTPGFTRGSRCIGVVAKICDRDQGGSISVSSAGGTFTERVEGSLGSPADAWRNCIADALAAEDYVDGASIAWSGLATTYPEVSQLYELKI